MIDTAFASTGAYGFRGLAAGDYQVEFVVPPDYTFTTPAILNVQLGAAQEYFAADAGAYSTGGSGGRAFSSVVWDDTTANGMRQQDRFRSTRMAVYLFDANDKQIATASFDSAGIDSFRGLGEGTYHVRFVLPVNHAFTTKDQGDDAVDSDAYPTSGSTWEIGDTDLISLMPGQSVAHIDVGLLMVGSGDSGI